ncbi:hypothetical protein B0H16DRAFT_1745468 [Mycena metata]|uniref:Uncharacterized protein n=1 Tax=Mycena metata TaxID=1033252 RepID=A0AAD7H3M1_9AGAR|nr:hypothetical protein B0H16DRAFT_1745468 [Mycena metata]
MPDWMANMLRSNSTFELQHHLTAKFKTLRRVNVGYNPFDLAQLIQYREWDIRGCPFLDQFKSLDLKLVRGYNLYEVILPERSHVKLSELSPAERDARLHMEKVVFSVLATPNLYQ